jgi:AcrR family transcriptional regulator
MTQRLNRKDLIIDTASQLFLKQGYEATSVRQIADAVGVTEAALYYHFKDKRELLQAVFACQMPNFKLILDECSACKSLEELMHRFGRVVAAIAPQMSPRLGWLISEYPNLGEEKHKLIHLKFMMFHDGLADLIKPFVHEHKSASTIAWTLICAAIGHSQLFRNLDLQADIDFPFTSLMDNLAENLD